MVSVHQYKVAGTMAESEQTSNSKFKTRPTAEQDCDMRLVGLRKRYTL